jgi:hypothetical protein
MSPGLQRKLLRRIAELKRVCAESYQVVGSLASDCGRFGDADIDKVLDNLSQMRPVHEDVLPFDSKPPAPWVVPSEMLEVNQPRSGA